MKRMRLFFYVFVTLVFSSVFLATYLMASSSDLIVMPYGWIKSNSPAVQQTMAWPTSNLQEMGQGGSNRFISMSDDGEIGLLGYWFIDGERRSEGAITVFSFVFQDLMYGSGPGIGHMGDGSDIGDVSPGLDTPPLVYPNPFRFEDSPQLGYVLSMNMTITLHFYDMFSHKLLEKTFQSGTPGGMANQNWIDLTPAFFRGKTLSSGVYFYLIIFEGDVIGKGKMAVIP